MFLSGGQTEDEAVENLDAIAALGKKVVSTKTSAVHPPRSSTTAIPSTTSMLPMPDSEAAFEEEAEFMAWGSLARRTRHELSAPWALSFSFGRALQTSVLKIWKGDDANREAAQNMLREKAAAASLASRGLLAEARRTKGAFKAAAHSDYGGGTVSGTVSEPSVYGMMTDGL